MANITTPYLGLVKPEINGAQTENVWGYDLNDNFDKIDARFSQLTMTEAPDDGYVYGRYHIGWARVAPLDSPVLIGNPQAPTAGLGDNDTTIATTAFVQAAGLQKADINSPAFTGNPTAPTPAPGDNDTSIATTAFVAATAFAAGAVLPSNVAPQTPGVANAGTSPLYSRGDHAHPADPTRVAKAGDTMTGTLTAPQYNLTTGGSVASGSDYLQLSGPSGGLVNLFLGGNTTTTNYYRNTGHYIQSRDAVVTFLTLNAFGVNVPLTIPSTSPSSGAFTVTGGMGVAGNGYFGGTLNCTGAFTTGGSITLPAGQLINLGSQAYLYGNAGTLVHQATTYHFSSLNGAVGYATLASTGLTLAAGLSVTGTASVGGALNVTGNISSAAGGLYLSGWSGNGNQSVIYMNANNSIYLYQTGSAFTFVGVPVNASNGAAVLNGTVLQAYGAGNSQAARLFHDNTYSWLQTPGTWVIGGLGGGPASTIFQGPGSTAYTNGAVIVQGGIGCSGNSYFAGAGSFGYLAAPAMGISGQATFGSTHCNDTVYAGGVFSAATKSYLNGADASWVLASAGVGVRYAGDDVEYGIVLRPNANNPARPIVLYNAAGTASVGQITHDATTTNYATSSDGRLKEDPQPFDAGPMIDALETWDFRWKDGGKRTYGIFAQDAAEVVPQACLYDEKQDQWFTDYSKFVPLLLAEMKALRARVAELEGRA